MNSPFSVSHATIPPQKCVEKTRIKMKTLQHLECAEALHRDEFPAANQKGLLREAEATVNWDNFNCFVS